MADFYPADVGRLIVASGGIGTITGYTDGQNITVQITQKFPATSFDSGTWSILGTPQAMCTPSAKDPVGGSVNLTLSAAGWRPEDAGKYVEINGGLCQIKTITSSTIAAAVIVKELAATVAAPALAWTLKGPCWSPAFGYPRCGTIYQGRLWLGGNYAFPKRLWGSVIGDYLDHTLGSLDTDAIAYDIGDGASCSILHLANARGLVALTDSGVFSIMGGQEKPITPTNIQITDQCNYGASAVAPVRVGGELEYVQRAGRKVRALSPNEYDSGQYNAPDMAVLAEHVTESGLVDMCYQAEPDPLIYGVRADGQLATLCADRDQDVFAWSRQLTQGGYESAAAVPTADGNRVFVIVARVVDGALTRYIEMFESGLQTDSAITGHSGAGASTWGGLSHLKGLRVNAKGDGVFLGKFDVSDAGSITLPRTANDVEIGLDYVTEILTLTPEFMGPIGSAQGHQLSNCEIKVRLLDTIGCAINLQTVSFRQLGNGILDQAPEPFTGDKKAGNLGWGDGVAQTLIQQTLPYPLHLLSVIAKITANEG